MIRSSCVLAALLGLFASGCAESASAESESSPPEESEIQHYSFFDGWAPDPYPLDPVPRFLLDGQRVRCDASTMVPYRSSALRYGVQVNPAFVPRLSRFERFVTDLAREHYGRAPRTLVHKGAFNCRSARGRSGRISEHAFGNALDFQGLDFPALRRNVDAPADMPRHLRRGFQLRVASHWSPQRERDGYHARFLHRLAEGLRQRPDIFRGIVGPPRPRHSDHLHLDAAPWRYAMFGYERDE